MFNLFIWKHDEFLLGTFSEYTVVLKVLGRIQEIRSF